MEPSTPLETLCRIILRAKEYEAQVPTDYDDGEDPENIDGEDGDALSVLDDSANSSVEEELRGILEDLADDQIAEVLAFCWVGQGTYDASDWDLVDATKKGKKDLAAMSGDELPPELRAAKPAQRQAYVEEKAKKRAELQRRIHTVNTERERYIAAERKKAPRSSADMDDALLGGIQKEAEASGFAF